MKVLLVSVENTLVCFGHRYVASSLKAGGHEVASLFSAREYKDAESPAELAAMAELARELRPDLLAFSLMSSHVPRFRAIRASAGGEGPGVGGTGSSPPSGPSKSPERSS